MQRVLQIIPQNILPVQNGGQYSIYNAVQTLAKEYEVAIVVLLDRDENFDQQLYKNLGVKCYYFRVNKKDNFKLIAFNFFSTLPFKFKKYYTQSGFEFITRICNEFKPQFIICHHAHLAQYCVKLKAVYPSIKFILREHNIEYLLVQQYFKTAHNPLNKLVAYWQYHKTKKTEKRFWNYFDKVLLISDSDFDEFKKTYNDNGSVLYDSFDFKTQKAQPKEPFFLYTGNLTAVQNRYNLKKFLKDVWIPFKEQNSNQYSLVITGSSNNTVNELCKTDVAKYNVNAVGFVDDLDDYFQKAKFFISPTYMGAGLRIKVVEAICKGCVVFLTTKDLVMIEKFKDLENVVVFNSLNDFFSKVKLLEHNQHLYHAISQQAINTSVLFSSAYYRNSFLKHLN